MNFFTSMYLLFIYALSAVVVSANPTEVTYRMSAFLLSFERNLSALRGIIFNIEVSDIDIPSIVCEYQKDNTEVS